MTGRGRIGRGYTEWSLYRASDVQVMLARDERRTLVFLLTSGTTVEGVVRWYVIVRWYGDFHVLHRGQVPGRDHGLQALV